MRRVLGVSDSLNNNLNEINKISRSDKSRFQPEIYFRAALNYTRVDAPTAVK